MLMVGQSISHYRIVDELGRGGMGVVYRAQDTRLDRPVALKFFPRELLGDPDAVKRFEREARAASALDHPNICTVYEVDEAEDGRTFIAMACYDGATLRLYVNGTQAATLAVSGSILTSNSPLRIGGNTVWSEWFSGLVDDVRIYNRVLTQAQIQTDMNTPVG